MNAPHTPSLFSAVELAPRDPILGINEAFAADPNPNKVNLGVGVYYDENGKLPLLECVKLAEREITDKGAPRGYLPIDGIPAYDKAVRALLFGADSEIVTSGRAVTVQALGGTGGLKIGADFLRRFAPGAEVYISTPSWENHRALFEGAGFAVHEYAYYGTATHGLLFAEMLASLQRIARGSIALDGISLTLSAVEADTVSVNIIPHTGQATTVRHWKAGRRVNVEVDLLAKYVERLLGERN